MREFSCGETDIIIWFGSCRSHLLYISSGLVFYLFTFQSSINLSLVVALMVACLAEAVGVVHAAGVLALPGLGVVAVAVVARVAHEAGAMEAG